MVQGIASFMGGSTREQQLRQQSKEKLLNTKTPIQKRRERRAGLKGGEGADSGIGKFATQLTLGAAPGAGYADMLGVFPDVEGGYEPSMLVNLQQAKRSFQEGNYKQAAAQGIFGALQGLGGAADTTLASAPFLGPAAPIAVKVGVGGKVLSSVGKKLVKKALPKKEKGIESLSVKDSVVNYVQSPSLMSRDELVKSLDSDPTVVEKSIKALKDLGKVNDDNTVTIYRRVPLRKGEELKDETVISGSHDVRAVRDADKALEGITTFDKFGQPKARGEEVFVKYKVPIDRIKGYLPEVGEYTRGTQARIQRAMQGKIDEKRKQGLGQFTKLKETKRIFEGLVNKEKEIIADVSGIKPEKLDRDTIRGFGFDEILEGKIKTADEFKKANPSVTFEDTYNIRLALAGGRVQDAITGKPVEVDKSLAINPKTGKKYTLEELTDFDKQETQKYIDKIRDDFGLNIKGTETKGIASLPTEQGATTKALDIETKIQPKGEIRSQGGFNFSKEVTQKNLQLHRTRLNKLKQGLPTAGEPKNKRIVLKSDNPDNPDFAIGKINFDDWIKRAEKVLSDDEIKGAANWYSDVYDYFKKAPYIRDEQEAKNLAQAWFAGAQRKSPQKALANVLSIRSLLRQGKTPEEILAMEKIPEGGLEGANKAILSVLTGREASGVGFKISDFRDSLDNKNVRAVMDNEPIGGQPFTVDVHTARDMGLVDPALLNLLKNKGYKIPDNILSDFGEGGLSNDLYQNRAIFGSELTEHLNDIKWKGKDDWQPAEIQAIGWTTLTNLYGGVNTAGNIRDALNLNIQRISMEVAPGEGSPWAKMFGKDYSELPIQEQIKINNEITNEAINEIAKSENVDLFNNVFGTGGWQTFVNPSTVQEVLGIKSEAIKLGAKLGYVLNQTEIYINASKSLTKNPQAYSYDLVERNTNKLRDSKYINDLFTKIYEKTDGVIVGFHPIETIDNKVGIRMIVGKDTVDNFYKKRKIPKKGNEAKKNQFFEKDLQKMMNDVINDVDEDFDLYTSESDLTVPRNDWTKEGEKDGQNYKQYFSEKTLTDATAKNDRVLDIIRQKLTDSFREKIRRAQGVKAPNEEIVEIIEDIPPIDKKAFGGFVESSNYDHYRII
jgi:hypothetical protein